MKGDEFGGLSLAQRVQRVQERAKKTLTIFELVEQVAASYGLSNPGPNATTFDEYRQRCEELGCTPRTITTMLATFRKARW